MRSAGKRPPGNQRRPALKCHVFCLAVFVSSGLLDESIEAGTFGVHPALRDKRFSGHSPVTLDIAAYDDDD